MKNPLFALFDWFYSLASPMNEPDEPKIENPKNDWVAAQIEHDKMMDEIEDRRRASEYQRAISDAAFERVQHWLNDPTSIYVPMCRPVVVYMSEMHKSRFGDKSFEELVDIEYREFQDKCMDREMQYYLEYWAWEKRFGIEMADSVMAEKKITLDEYLKSKIHEN